jgi:hypothetical protein
MSSQSSWCNTIIFHCPVLKVFHISSSRVSIPEFSLTICYLLWHTLLEHVVSPVFWTPFFIYFLLYTRIRKCLPLMFIYSVPLKLTSEHKCWIIINSFSLLWLRNLVLCINLDFFQHFLLPGQSVLLISQISSASVCVVFTVFSLMVLVTV